MGNYYFCFRVVTGYLNKIMDRGPWWDTVHRVEKSWTRLKQLSRNTHTHTATRRRQKPLESLKRSGLFQNSLFLLSVVRDGER